MKKASIIVMAFLMLLTFVGCTAVQDSGTSGSEPSSSPSKNEVGFVEFQTSASINFNEIIEVVLTDTETGYYYTHQLYRINDYTANPSIPFGTYTVTATVVSSAGLDVSNYDVVCLDNEITIDSPRIAVPVRLRVEIWTPVEPSGPNSSSEPTDSSVPPTSSIEPPASSDVTSSELPVSPEPADYDPDANHEAPKPGDIFETEDYIYSYKWFPDSIDDIYTEDRLEPDIGWNVRAKTDKAEYERIYDAIYGEPVTHMFRTFMFCRNMTVSPEIPKYIVDMCYTFCNTSITEAPKLPTGLLRLAQTFSGTSITVAPEIPNTVTEIFYAFSGTKIVIMPVIPDSVIDMAYAFTECEYLETATAIPSGVKDMTSIFDYCPSLTGEIEINANPERFNYAFSGTSKPITLTGSASQETLEALAATSSKNNITINASSSDNSSKAPTTSREPENNNSQTSTQQDWFDNSELTGTQADVGKVVGYSSLIKQDITVVSVEERTTSDGRKVIQTNYSFGSSTVVVECEYCHEFPCPDGGGKNCSQYDVLKDGTVYCSRCGKLKGDGYNGTCEGLIDWANGGSISCNYYD